MSHHWISLALLVLALGLYVIGLTAPSSLALAGAGVTELVFWRRLLRSPATD